MGRAVDIAGVGIGGRRPLALIAGPCVIESRESCLDLARRLAGLARRERIPLVFKASYDKANRSSHRSYRGPGLEAGLAILAEVKALYGLPILTDVHAVSEVARAAAVADVLQIPAFLCRQTDLLTAAAGTARAVNIKKGQFLAPGDMVHAVAKVRAAGGRRVLVTERGASFGYNNLVADMRSLLILKKLAVPVIFDATHSVQRPGGAGETSAGDACWAPALARAAVATGCDGVFIETHVTPEKALSDSANAVAVGQLGRLWRVLRGIDELVS